MKDMRYADLTIVKKIKASDITWAHGNPTFIFTVKGKDINGKDRTFQNYVEFTENYVNSHTDGQGYVELSVTWNKIPVGEDYTVTEQDVFAVSSGERYRNRECKDFKITGTGEGRCSG